MLEVTRKSLLVGLFIDWCKKYGYNIDYSILCHCQMAITCRIKKLFSDVVQTQQSFKGITFKKEYKELMKMADRKKTLQDEGVQE